MLSKGLSCAVILLFLGVAFAPGITATMELSKTQSQIVGKETLDNDLVEITVEVGNSEHKVLLTPEQAAELENLIDSMKAQLDAATTIRETSRIFDDTVVSLYKMGMLPDGMSVMDVQRLVKGVNQYARIGALNAVSTRNPSISDNRTNMVCLIVGETDHTLIVGRPIYVMILYDLLYEHLIFPHRIFEVFLESIFWINFFIKLEIPLSLADAIYLGHGDFNGGILPASGWVYTNGLNGMKRWEGDLYGNLTPVFIFYQAVYGFSGISFYFNDMKFFYLGTALWVKISEASPIGVYPK